MFRKTQMNIHYLETLTLEVTLEVTGLTPILKNICQRLLLHCTRTTHCYLFVLLYIQHLHPHHPCYSRPIKAK